MSHESKPVLTCAHEQVFESISSAKCTPEGKEAGLSWLASTFSPKASTTTEGAGGPGPEPSHLKDILKSLSIGLSDKAAAVRGAAGKLCEALAHVQRPGFTPTEISTSLSSLSDKQVNAEGKKQVSEALSKALNGSLPPPHAATGGGGGASRVGVSSAPTVRSSTTSIVASKSISAAGAAISVRCVSAPPSSHLLSTTTCMKFSVFLSSDFYSPLLLPMVCLIDLSSPLHVYHRASTTRAPSAAIASSNLRSSINSSLKSGGLGFGAKDEQGPLLSSDGKKEERAKKGKFKVCVHHLSFSFSIALLSFSIAFLSFSIALLSFSIALLSFSIAVLSCADDDSSALIIP